MSHKDAPPETESQKACREWWEKARPTVKRAWGRAQDGSFLAEETRLIHQAWEAASQQANAEVERLRAEVERLRADLMESDEIREKLSHLLTRTAVALKGEPPEGVWHSWHDLPEKAERLRADRDSWEQQASDRVADWHAEHLRAERLAEALEICLEMEERPTIIKMAREALGQENKQ